MSNQVSDQIDEGRAEVDQNQQTKSEDTSSTQEDRVAYETYRKTLSEAKRAKQERDELNEKLRQLEQEKLTAEGNKDQLIESLKREREELSGKLKTAVGSFARSRVHETLMGEMSKAGCQDPEIVIRAYGEDLSEVDFDDQFSPDRDQIKAMVDKIKGERPYLFGKNAPKLADHKVNPEGVGEKPRKPLHKMSEDELLEHWSKAEKLKR